MLFDLLGGANALVLIFRGCQARFELGDDFESRNQFVRIHLLVPLLLASLAAALGLRFEYLTTCTSLNLWYNVR